MGDIMTEDEVNDLLKEHSLGQVKHLLNLVSLIAAGWDAQAPKVTLRQYTQALNTQLHHKGEPLLTTSLDVLVQLFDSLDELGTSILLWTHRGNKPLEIIKLSKDDLAVDPRTYDPYIELADALHIELQPSETDQSPLQLVESAIQGSIHLYLTDLSQARIILKLHYYLDLLEFDEFHFGRRPAQFYRPLIIGHIKHITAEGVNSNPKGRSIELWGLFRSILSDLVTDPAIQPFYNLLEQFQETYYRGQPIEAKPRTKSKAKMAQPPPSQPTMQHHYQPFVQSTQQPTPQPFMQAAQQQTSNQIIQPTQQQIPQSQLNLAYAYAPIDPGTGSHLLSRDIPNFATGGILVKKAAKHLVSTTNDFKVEKGPNDTFVASKVNPLRPELPIWSAASPSITTIDYKSRQAPQRIFDHFPMYQEYAGIQKGDMSTLPPENTRLTDLWLGLLLLLSSYSESKLAERYPADFGTDGKIRLARPPHGESFKVYVPLKPSDLRAGGTLYYGLVNGTNLMVGDAGARHNVHWLFKAPKGGRPKGVGWDENSPCPLAAQSLDIYLPHHFLVGERSVQPPTAQTSVAPPHQSYRAPNQSIYQTQGQPTTNSNQLSYSAHNQPSDQPQGQWTDPAVQPSYPTQSQPTYQPTHQGQGQQIVHSGPSSYPAQIQPAYQPQDSPTQSSSRPQSRGPYHTQDQQITTPAQPSYDGPTFQQHTDAAQILRLPRLSESHRPQLHGRTDMTTDRHRPSASVKSEPPHDQPFRLPPLREVRKESGDWDLNRYRDRSRSPGRRSSLSGSLSRGQWSGRNDDREPAPSNRLEQATVQNTELLIQSTRAAERLDSALFGLCDNLTKQGRLLKRIHKLAREGPMKEEIAKQLEANETAFETAQNKRNEAQEHLRHLNHHIDHGTKIFEHEKPNGGPTRMLEDWATEAGHGPNLAQWASDNVEEVNVFDESLWPSLKTTD